MPRGKYEDGNTKNEQTDRYEKQSSRFNHHAKVTMKPAGIFRATRKPRNLRDGKAAL